MAKKTRETRTTEGAEAASLPRTRFSPSSPSIPARRASARSPAPSASRAATRSRSRPSSSDLAEQGARRDSARGRLKRPGDLPPVTVLADHRRATATASSSPSRSSGRPRNGDAAEDRHRPQARPGPGARRRRPRARPPRARRAKAPTTPPASSRSSTASRVDRARRRPRTTRGGARIEPVDRKQKELVLDPADAVKGAKDGDLVAVES